MLQRYLNTFNELFTSSGTKNNDTSLKITNHLLVVLVEEIQAKIELQIQELGFLVDFVDLFVFKR